MDKDERDAIINTIYVVDLLASTCVISGSPALAALATMLDSAIETAIRAFEVNEDEYPPEPLSENEQRDLRELEEAGVLHARRAVVSVSSPRRSG